MEFYHLQVNHVTNPMGYAMESPVFSWKIRNASGKHQKSARIRVASDAGMRNVLFESGELPEASGTGFEAEMTLAPCTRYYWNVEVEAENGERGISETAWFETGKLFQPWKGKWITCDSTKSRHPRFETEIRTQAGKQVERARLYICGLGLYEAYYEGEKIGEEYLAPGCNNYNQWVQYQTYDITEQLREKGTLSVLLGNGWYKGRFGFAAREDKGYYGQTWKLIAEVQIHYTDGTIDILGTDENWRVIRSSIVSSSIYDGESIDTTLPSVPEERAVLCKPPKGRLTERRSLPVTAHERFAPVKILHTSPGETIVDFGQEFAGIFLLRVKEPAGTKIHVQTGEVLSEGSLYRDNLRRAKSEFIYISDGEERIIRPHFTYYGYRYLKIEGIRELKKEDVTGLALYSDIELTGNITTGNSLVNQLFSNICWGMKSNFVDVPTDCPQRDERMGWTGDAQVFSPTALYLSDAYAFYGKYLYDMYTEQQENGGKVPDVIPAFGEETTAAVWGDAACILPWNLYLFYGDKSILRAQYESMRDWVEYIRSVDGDDAGWGRAFQYGDWLALDHPGNRTGEVRGGTDEEFIAGVYYAASAELTAKAAEELSLAEDAEKYRALAREQFARIRREYYSESGRCCIKTQTALLLTLKYGLSDNTELTRQMLEKLFSDCGKKLTTGFVGTPLLCNVLSEHGFSKLAFELLLNEEYPGWLHEVKLGATTVWERWNSLGEDGKVSDTSMNSLNHYAYGSVGEWMFRHMAGLSVRSDEYGCKKIDICPELNWDIRNVAARWDSPAGMYRLSWELLDENHVRLEISIPFDCEARVILPLAGEEAFQKLEAVCAEMGEKPRKESEGVYSLSAGEYEITYETTQALKKRYTTYLPIKELMENPKINKELGSKLSLDKIPGIFYEKSMRQIAEQFGSMGEEQLDAVDKLLAEF